MTSTRVSRASSSTASNVTTSTATPSDGSNSSSNYLWTSGNEGSPIPFARVWIRPQILNSAAGFSPIPAQGYAAATKPATLKNRSELANWGVVGLDHTNETNIEPYKTNVLSMKVTADRTASRRTRLYAGCEVVMAAAMVVTALAMV